MWYIVSQLWQVSCCPFSGNISPSSLLPNNPTFIKCPEHTLGKALTLDVLCTSSGITAILNLFLLQIAMSFFSFFWDKVIKGFSPFKIIRWWLCRGLPSRATFDRDKMIRNFPHEGQKRDTRPDKPWLRSWNYNTNRINM